MNNKIQIKTAKKKDYKKINKFYNNYYKTNRSIKQYLWLFRKSINSKSIKNYYYSLSKNKIIGISGFIKFSFISNNKKFTVIKPEDLLMNVEAIKNKIFKKIHIGYEKKALKSNTVFFLFNKVGWAYKKLNFKINFGNKFIFIKYYNPNSLASAINKRKIPKIFAIIISYLIIYINKVLRLKITSFKNKKLTLVDYKSPPKWSSKISNKFVIFWRCMTVHRSKDFLKWRVFDNPYVNCKFTAFFFNKKPLGYVIYTTNGGNLSITDIIIVPYNSVINTKLIINEVLDFLDQYCAKKKLNYCKFELYLNHKLNNLIYNQLIKVGYIKKEINTDFSFKILNKNINNKLIKNSYITNINRSGKHN